MFSNSIKKALVVAGVALTLPVLSAGTAYAGSNGSGTHDTTVADASASSDHGKSGETDPSRLEHDP